MKTITIQIGNSDDKLTQKEWSAFCEKVEDLINHDAEHCHFTGYSAGDAPWQNACYVVEVSPARLPIFKECLKLLRSGYDQDSIAWTEGITEFV